MFRMLLKKSLAIVRRLFRGMFDSSLFRTKWLSLFERPVLGLPDLDFTSIEPEFLC